MRANDARIVDASSPDGGRFRAGVVVHSRSPSEASLSIRLLWAFARRVGSDDWSAKRLAAVGILAEQFADPDARIPHSAAMRLLDEVMTWTKNPAIGLHAAELSEAGDFDILEYAARGSPDLGKAFECLARYFRLMNEAAEIKIGTDGERSIISYRVTDGIRQPRAAIDFAVASLVNFARRNTTFDETGMEIRFTFPEPPYVADYQRFFRCKIRFGATENAIVLPRVRLDTRMTRVDGRITRAFELRAEHLLDRLKQGDGMSGRVRDLSIKHLGSGQVTMAWAARRLAMSVPTLRRHLEAEGTTFSAVVDEVRKQLAGSQLRNGTSVSELAFALGFSSVSAFHRAFKRWTGMSPAEYRRTAAHREQSDPEAAPAPREQSSAEAAPAPREPAEVDPATSAR
jgi:AraC-like DNA-binding protein